MDFDALSVVLKRSKKKVQQQAVVVFMSRLYATVQLVGSVKLLDVGVDPNNLPNIGDKVIIQRPNDKQDWIITSTFTEPRLGSNALVKSTNLELIDSISLDENADYIFFTMDRVYTYFQLALGLRTTKTAIYDHAAITLNGDTTAANYYATNLSYYSAAWAVNAYNGTVGYGLALFTMTAASNTANLFGLSNITMMNIPGQYLIWQAQSFVPGPYQTISSGYYKQTNPITSIKLNSSSGSGVQLVSGSTAYLFAM